MRKINLKAKNIGNENVSRKYSSQTSSVIAVVLLLIAVILYGGVFYLNSAENKKIISLNNNISNLKNKLDRNKSYKELYNFQDKLLEIDSISKDKIIQVNVLKKISEATLNESVAKNLKITMKDGQSDVEITTKIPDLSALSKQVNSYTQIDDNKEALLKSSSLKEDGLEALIKFMIKDLISQDNKTNINK